MRIFLSFVFSIFLFTGVYSQAISPAGPVSFCVSGVLTVTGVIGSPTFQWQNNGVDIPGATLINYTATASGNYSVVLNGTLPAIDTTMVTINPNPSASFTFSNNVCSGLPVQFTSSVGSGTAPFTYAWNFGDGGTSTSQNPAHIFASLGCNTANFTVTLVVTDANGCTNSIANIVTIKQAPDVRLQDQDIFTPFSNCDNSPTPGNPNFTLSVQNSSPSAACITSYTLDWGDGSAIVPLSPGFGLQTHTYTQLGAFDLVITAVGNNGCNGSKTYRVANQSNPAGGLSTLGSTTGLCAPSIVPFIINTWQNNSPGTIYSLNFGDGTTVILNHPLNPGFTPDTVYHTYTTSSCPASSFTATLKVINACDTTPYTAGNIQVRIKPTASFTATPNPSCVGQNVCFTNTGSPGSYGANCSTANTYSWDFGDGSPINTTQSPCHIYSVAGTYTVSLTSSNPCGSSTFTMQICVTPAPSPSFTIDNNNGCTPLAVNATNTTNTFGGCAPVTYLWSVTYAAGFCGATPLWNFTNGTNASSINPSFLFINPGTYTIKLSATNPCGTFIATTNVTVKKPPTVAITAVPNACGTVTFTPSAVVGACTNNPLTYLWTFGGGSPATSSSLNPGPVTFTGVGVHTITLNVTNECGQSATSTNFTIDTVSVSNAGPNQSLCGTSVTLSANTPVIGTGLWTKQSGGVASITSPSSPTTTVTGMSAGTYVFKWTITNGTCISSSTVTITIIAGVTPAAAGPDQGLCLATNATLSANTPVTGTGIWTQTGGALSTITTPSSPNTTVTGLAPGVYTYRWTVSLAGCSSSSDDVIITIYDNPTIPDAGPDQTICAASTVMAANTALIGSGLWAKISGPLATITTPASPTTTVTGLSAGTYLFKWTISNGACPAIADTVQIVVLPFPTASAAGPDQSLCAATTVTLAGNNPTNGTGVWSQTSGPNTATIVNPVSPTSSVTGLIFGVYVFRWTISNGTCTPSFDDVQMTISDNATVSDAGPSQTVCGTTVTMAANTPLIGTGLWTRISGPNIPLIVTPSSPNTIINGMIPGAYIFKWTITNGACISSSNVSITIIAGVTPSSAGPDQGLCLATSTSLAANTPTTGSGIWTIISGPNTPVITSPSSPTSTLTGLTVGVYTLRWAISFGSCTPSTDDVVITIYDNPTPAIAGPGQTICSPNTIMAGNNPSIGTGLWSRLSGPNNPVIVSPSSPTTSITGLIAGTYIFQWTISNGSCPPSNSTVQIIVTPFPTTASAGPDQTVCALTNITLAGNTPVTGTGSWSQISGAAANITTASSPTSTVTGLVPGLYVFRWTISNGACPPSTDDVSINVLTDIQNNISANPTTICSGQSITLNGALPTGGTGIYNYQWQQSSDGITWTDILLATSQNYTVVLSTSTYFRRKVTSLPCQTFSNIIFITVQAAITNNSISPDQSICINTAASNIIGVVPSGGNGIYNYQWQQSTDGGITWTNIIGANLKDYNPGVLSQTIKYRRNVSTALCNGPQTSPSNIVTITVNPNAKALYLPTDTIGCAPFNITAAIVNLQPFPANNAQYYWYVNGVQVGVGPVFPGTTILNPDDSIVLKLKTTSLFGCLNDSISHKFITRKRPNPSFTLSDTVGCGPLSVLITNTTPSIGSFTYLWDFGNGSTSNAVQPGNIIFQPNPNFGDTIYIIKLKVTTVCDTITISKSIRVQSKPKALFTPVRSSGCSPFTAVFTNTSRGSNNNYNWNFGDGSFLNTNSNAPVSHTYNTGGIDTFYVVLRATNNCGTDSLRYALIVSPNTIHLLYGVNGNELNGCAPHTVHFINNSNGASSFFWNFGDGSPIFSTTQNVDTVVHTYFQTGSFIVTLRATNACSDTSAPLLINVFKKPLPAFIADKYFVCIGDTVHFTNQTDTATSYLWQFGDGANSTLVNPRHSYSVPGLYRVILTSSRLYPSGSACTDTVSRMINVVAGLPGHFDVSDSIGQCAPFSITFINTNLPAVSANWDFGDGSFGTGNTVTHVYLHTGTFIVKLTVTDPGGCKYTSQRPVSINGPDGVLLYTGGFYCNNQQVRLEATISNTDSLLWDFGDGSTLLTTQRIVFHTYAFAGAYVPRVTLLSNSGCQFPVQGFDTIKVDKIKAGFTNSQLKFCSFTTVQFTDTSRAYFGFQTKNWSFGDGGTGTGNNVSHTYTAPGNYIIRLIVRGNSNCSDTVTQQIFIGINNKPVVAIQGDTIGCVFTTMSFNAVIQSTDSINLISWNVSNGVTASGTPLNISFSLPGIYTIRLVVGTIYGCFDTVYHTVKINPTPIVSTNNDMNLCLGNSVPLFASGATQYSWNPPQGLSCINCSTPIASPGITTTYVVRGLNGFGCAGYDTVTIQVINPLQITVSANDSICIGQSVQLMANGASSYLWSPSLGLNAVNIPNPVSTPASTVQYRVIGKDGYNCFTDTAYVIVAVGQYPIVKLGPDISLSTGTQYSFNPVIQFGPIRNWLWTPATNLNCNTCPSPVATIKNDITYLVKVTTNFGCSASDTINIKVFCEGSQVFIPTGFSPDGDGLNDVLMVRGTGILTVKSFRIFNRWGELIFDKANFPPNNPVYGWDGMVRGKKASPDVFVYTVEVICDNGTPYTFKGNTTLLK